MNGLTPEDRQAIALALGKVDKRLVMNILKSIDEGKVPPVHQLDMLRSAATMPDNPTPSADAEFQLDENLVPDGQAGAAQFYGVSVKAIKRWCASGRAAKELPPLRTPAQMPAWWERTHKNPVPECITAAAAKVAAQPATSVNPSAAALPSGLPSLDLSKFNPADFGYDSALMAARVVVMAQQEMLVDACKSGDDSRRRKAMKDFADAAENLRRVEKDSGKIQAEQGITLRRDEVRAAMIEIHGSIPSRFKAALRKAVKELPGLTMTDAETSAWAEQVVDSVCQRLTESKFAASDKETAAAA